MSNPALEPLAVPSALRASAAAQRKRLGGQELREGLDVLTQPVDELAPVDAARRQIQHEPLLLVQAGVILGAVQHERRFHGGMAHALVPVNEGVISHQRERTPPVASRSRR